MWPDVIDTNLYNLSRTAVIYQNPRHNLCPLCIETSSAYSIQLSETVVQLPHPDWQSPDMGSARFIRPL